MKKVLIIVILFLSCSLFAFYRDIPVTRDLDPNARYDTYLDWKNDHPQTGTQVQEIGRNFSENRDNAILIVVNTSLYNSIEPALQTYQNDLANEGYNSIVLQFNGTSHQDLKFQFMFYYQEENIDNAVLIGDLPVAWFEMFEDWNNNGIQDDDENWVEFPCDLYFSDINGDWEDSDSNGIYDYHEGDKHPEIGIGRIAAHNMDLLNATEAESINEYFLRNHLFRTGVISANNISLAYIDDDWSDWGTEYQQAMQMAYPAVELVNDIEATTAWDYSDNRLINDYEMIQVHVHSGPEAHYFYFDNGANYQLVQNFQIPPINPNAHFYNLFACSNSRFTTPNNMGGIYIYGSDHCLGTIGSTKTGSMLNFEEFYQPFDSATIGEALRLWWAETVDVGDDWMWQRAWFYGMVIQGDPSLQREYAAGNVLFVPQDFPTIQEAIDNANDGYTIIVSEGIYSETLEIDSKNLTLISSGPTEYCIIDGNSSDSVIKLINCDSTLVDGFTIQNGNAAYGGGGIYIQGSPTVKNCVIQNNSASRGGGIYIIGSPLIDNNTITNNSVTVAGGAICSYGGSAIISHNEIQENYSDYLAGGIHVEDSQIVTITSNFIENNSADAQGGGICFYAEGQGGILENNLIVNNAAVQSSALSFSFGNYTLINNTIANNEYQDQAIVFIDYAEAVLINNIIWDNAVQEIVVQPEADVEIRYCDIQGSWTGEGNIDVDPQFINPDLGIYTLSMYSLCIGSGIDELQINGSAYFAPTSDMQGNPRPNPSGTNPDMGAIESILGEPNVEVSSQEIPVKNIRLSNYPNPFNPETTISFDITAKDAKNAKLEIFNLKGQKVKTLECIRQLPDAKATESLTHSLTWNGRNENGKPVSSGVYFYKLKIGNEAVASSRMLLLK